MQPQVEDKKIVNLDAFAAKIAAAQEARRNAEELIAFAEGIEAEIKEAMGDAIEATVFGAPRFTYNKKQAFRFAEFKKDHPHIYRNYVEMVEQPVLNKEKLLAEQGDVLADYQTREFRWVNKKPGA